MSQILDCPACGQKMSVPDDGLGQQLLCPSCRAPVDLGMTLEEIPELDHLDVVEDEEDSSGTYRIDAEDARQRDAVGPRASVSGALGTLSLGRDADVVRCLALHPGRQLGLASCGDTIFVLNLDEGKRAFCFEKQRALVSCLAVAPDGRRALSGDRKGGLVLWDTSTGRVLRWLDGHCDEVRSVAFAPSGRYAISGGDDGATRLWELETGAECELFEARWNHPVTCVAFSPDGRQALGAGNKMCTWSVKTGEPLVRFRGGGGVASAAFSGDGSTIGACEPNDGSGTGLRARHWQAATGKPMPYFENPEPNRASVSLAVVVPGTLQIVSTGKKGVRRALTGEVAEAAVASVVTTVAMNVALLPFGFWGYAIYGPSGGRQSDPSDPYCLQVWSLHTGRPYSYDAGTEPAVALAVAADGTRALTASRTNIVQLWGLGP